MMLIPALRRGGLVVGGALLLASLVLLTAWRAPAPAADPPPGAMVWTRVQVPESMHASPFDVERYLQVPPGFRIAVYARVFGARFMAVAPNGDLLVAQPSSGRVLLVRPSAAGDPLISEFVVGLRRPHDIVFHTIDDQTYVYIAETHQVTRYPYGWGDSFAHDPQVVVGGLPDSSTPELGGAYGHELKNIALGPDHMLYVSIASTCNACVEDTQSEPVRGAIYQYQADGSGGRLFARGLRNAEGLAFLPGSNELWAAVNNRDNLTYPHHNDFDGDGADDYGRIMQGYVDNHPPEEFTRVRDGGNYGWPFCNPTPDSPSGYTDMPFDPDVEFNADGSRLDCASADRISMGIQAHSAPLGLTFLQESSFPAAYRNGATIGLHGSWNRAIKTGYTVAYFPWDSQAQRPGPRLDLVSGWLDQSSGSAWGRPVDTAVDLQGGLLISDDAAGAIYRLSPLPGGGDGLRADYFSAPDWYGPSLARIDAAIDFDWGFGPPDPAIEPDTFAVRWSGTLVPRFSEPYTFYTTSDDGVRLWVDGQLIIDNWTDHEPTGNSGTISLLAGQRHAIAMEFYENSGRAVARLEWSSPSQPREVVPQSQLYSGL